MPIPSRLRANNQYGAIGVTLLAGALTMNSPQFVNLPNVNQAGQNDILVLTIDPQQVGGAPEIVYVTSHGAGNPNATIVRAREGTSARQHSTSEVWVAGITALDLDVRRYRARIVATGQTNLPNGQQQLPLSLAGYQGYDPAGMVLNDGTTSVAINLPYTGDYLVTFAAELFFTPPANTVYTGELRVWDFAGAIVRAALTIPVVYVSTTPGGYSVGGCISTILSMTAGTIIQPSVYTAAPLNNGHAVNDATRVFFEAHLLDVTG